jgi:hypothetical protein
MTKITYFQKKKLYSQKEVFHVWNSKPAWKKASLTMSYNYFLHLKHQELTIWKIIKNRKNVMIFQNHRNIQ